MKFRSVCSVVFSAFVIAACSSGTESADGNLGTSGEEIIGPSTPGGRNEVVFLYVRFIRSDGSLGVRTCTGSYFAPRVVVTAAHCLESVFADQLFVYYGDNFSADFAQLTPGGNGLKPPAPGQASFWAQADSVESHPGYDPAQHYPDLGVVYLDRKLPFDPLPLSRNQLAANRQVTISGWGANSAPTPITGAGGGVQRTGTTVTLGSPTLADFHAEDPNPGLLIAANRANQIKLSGALPNANACFGDSGGPILINDSGQIYVAGIGYFVGLSCRDYSLFMRVNSFLPFLDQAYKKGGQEVLTPTFDCVAPNAQGTLTAFFGYNNKNGVAVTVPYGAKNNLARDTTNMRPNRFLPGQHHYAFPVDFASNQSVTWTLSPENSPTTTLTVNQNSRRCGAADFDQRECGLACRASQRSGCPNLPTFEGCVNFCLENTQFFRDAVPGCVPQNTAVNVCTAAVSASPANWVCDDFFGGIAFGPCAAQYDALNTCFSSQ